MAEETNEGVVDGFLAQTSVGRIMDAFGQGAKFGWGTTPLGLSEDSEAKLREAGIFKDVESSLTDSLKTFNQALIRPAASVLDTLVRTGSAAITGTASAVGQAAEELGGDQGMARRLTRDTIMLAETLGITAGVAPARGPARIATTDIPAAPRGPAAKVFPKVEPVTAPTEVLKKADGPRVDKAGNINLDRILAPEDVKNVIRESVAGDEFATARRGKMSLAQTEELADSMGMTPEALIKRNVGTAFNAEEAVAARNLLVQSAEKVRDLAARAASGADADVIAFQEATTRHVAIQEQIAGMTAEAGRALSSFRILAKGTEGAKDLGDVLTKLGGRDDIIDVAKRIGSLDTPQKISKFLADTRQAKASDMAVELWINALLSGPQTHAVNTTSNALISLWTVPETALASGIGSVRKALGGRATERVVFGEAGARLHGFVQGAKDGIRAGWEAYKTESVVDPNIKLEVPRQRAIPSKKIKLGDIELEIGGKQVRIPGRLLMAEDEFFKSIGYRQELNALAYRQASKEKLSGRAFAGRVAELVNNPTEGFVRKATENANYQTFTKTLGKTGRSIQSFSNTHPLAKLIVPFVRTPVNIVKFAGERSPLGLFSQKVRAVLRGEEGEVARDTQMARMIAGSAVGAAAVGLAVEGHITGGGPTDPRQRAVMFLTGWQPYSVRIGDMYYSYGRLEPLGVLLGVNADMAEIATSATDIEADDLAALVMASVSKNLVSKTWLQGPSDLIQAVNDPDRYGGRYVQRLFGTVVPTGVAQVARVEDPFLRDARTLTDTIKSRMPGLSKELFPRRDIWGNPIALGGGLGPDLLSPVYQSRINDDPIAQELLSLEIWPSKLDRHIRGVELTPEQYDRYQIYAGRLARRNLELMIIGTPGWSGVDEFTRRETITNTITKSRDTARSLMLMKNPDIVQGVLDERMARFEPKTK